MAKQMGIIRILIMTILYREKYRNCCSTMIYFILFMANFQKFICHWEIVTDGVSRITASRT